jgi:hypothetical protein
LRGAAAGAGGLKVSPLQEVKPFFIKEDKAKM